MNENSARATFLLFLLFFFGLAVILLAWIDLQWTHRLLVKTPHSRLSPSSSFEPLVRAPRQQDRR